MADNLPATVSAATALALAARAKSAGAALTLDAPQDSSSFLKRVVYNSDSKAGPSGWHIASGLSGLSDASAIHLGRASFDAVLLAIPGKGGKTDVQRIFYPKPYDQNASPEEKKLNKPVCWSHDGVAPASEATAPQGSLCRTCPRSTAPKDAGALRCGYRLNMVLGVFHNGSLLPDPVSISLPASSAFGDERVESIAAMANDTEKYTGWRGVSKEIAQMMRQTPGLGRELVVVRFSRTDGAGAHPVMRVVGLVNETDIDPILGLKNDFAEQITGALKAVNLAAEQAQAKAEAEATDPFDQAVRDAEGAPPVADDSDLAAMDDASRLDAALGQ